MIESLNWKGYLTKKAFKTAAKNSWKKRYFVFDAASLCLRYYDKPPAPGAALGRPKGEFVLDPSDMSAAFSADHSKLHEIKIASKGNSLYAYPDTFKEGADLIARLDAARRAKVAGDDGSKVLLAGGSEASAAGGAGLTSAREPGAKCFTWGVGAMLAVGNADIQSISLPRRVAVTKPLRLCTGPEHAAVQLADEQPLVWGSNEFGQLAMPPDFAVAYRPAPLLALAGRSVVAIACGGSHTLALVSPAGGGAPVVHAWGTGTVGQLGLGESRSVSEAPAPVTLSGGGAPPVAVFAGLVSSAALSGAGEAFLWGDASLGRLGLPGLVDPTRAGEVPVCVNDAKVWTPQPLPIPASALQQQAASLFFDAAPAAAPPRVVSIALGGSFTLLLVDPGGGASGAAPAAGGGVLLVAGGLGIDITRDPYASTVAASAFDARLADEIRAVPRSYAPRPVAPFGATPVVLALAAGARHAAVIAVDGSPPAPRLFCAGKGWLGDDSGGGGGGGGGSLLLPEPTVRQAFVRVGGALLSEDVVEVACGHSHTVARTPDGRLFAWGRGDSGELGLRDLSDGVAPAPVPRPDGHAWTQVGAGSYYTAALAEPLPDGADKLHPTSAAAAIAAVREKTWAATTAAQAFITGPSMAVRGGTAAAAAAAAESGPVAFTSGGAFKLTQAARPSAISAALAPLPLAAAAAGSAADAPAHSGGSASPEDPAVSADGDGGAPEPAAAAEGGHQPLPDGWDYEYNDEGTIYFIRPDGETQWEDPRE